MTELKSVEELPKIDVIILCNLLILFKESFVRKIHLKKRGTRWLQSGLQMDRASSKMTNL